MESRFPHLPPPLPYVNFPNPALFFNGRLLKDKAYLAENKKKLDQMYPFERS